MDDTDRGRIRRVARAGQLHERWDATCELRDHDVEAPVVEPAAVPDLAERDQPTLASVAAMTCRMRSRQDASGVFGTAALP